MIMGVGVDVGVNVGIDTGVDMSVVGVGVAPLVVTLILRPMPAPSL